MAKNETKNADGSISIRNMHGTHTAASEEAIACMLSTAHPVHGLARRMMQVWDGCEHPVTGKLITEAHCRRYSERSLAIMLCDAYADDVAKALASK